MADVSVASPARSTLLTEVAAAFQDWTPDTAALASAARAAPPPPQPPAPPPPPVVVTGTQGALPAAVIDAAVAATSALPAELAAAAARGNASIDTACLDVLAIAARSPAGRARLLVWGAGPSALAAVVKSVATRFSARSQTATASSDGAGWPGWAPGEDDGDRPPTPPADEGGDDDAPTSPQTLAGVAAAANTLTAAARAVRTLLSRDAGTADRTPDRIQAPPSLLQPRPPGPAPRACVDALQRAGVLTALAAAADAALRLPSSSSDAAVLAAAANALRALAAAASAGGAGALGERSARRGVAAIASLVTRRTALVQHAPLDAVAGVQLAALQALLAAAPVSPREVAGADAAAAVAAGARWLAAGAGSGCLPPVAVAAVFALVDDALCLDADVPPPHRATLLPSLAGALASALAPPPPHDTDDLAPMIAAPPHTLTAELAAWTSRWLRTADSGGSDSGGVLAALQCGRVFSALASRSAARLPGAPEPARAAMAAVEQAALLSLEEEGESEGGERDEVAAVAALAPTSDAAAAAVARLLVMAPSAAAAALAAAGATRVFGAGLAGDDAPATRRAAVLLRDLSAAAPAGAIALADDAPTCASLTACLASPDADTAAAAAAALTAAVAAPRVADAAPCPVADECVTALQAVASDGPTAARLVELLTAGATAGGESTRCALRRAGAAVAAAHVLSAARAPRPLVPSVLALLTALVTDSPTGRADVAAAPGWDALTAAVERAVGGGGGDDDAEARAAACAGLLALATETTPDTLASSTSHPSEVHSPGAVTAALTLARRAVDPAAATVDTIARLIAGRLANAAACDGAGVLAAVLDWLTSVERDAVAAQTPPPAPLATALLSAARAAATHSMTGADLHALFALLAPGATPGGTPASCHDGVVALLAIAARRGGPSCFVDLDGSGGGILRTRPLKPLPRGYTVAAWVRVEEAPPPGAPAVVAALLAPAPRGGDHGGARGGAPPARGVLLTLSSDDTLTLTCVGPAAGAGAGVDAVTLPAGVGARRWRLITVAHAPGGPLSLPRVRLFVDGLPIGAAAVRYPRAAGAFTLVSFGGLAPGAADAVRAGGAGGVSSSPSSLVGQVTSAFLFDDALSDDAVAVLASAGPEYQGVFDPAERDAGAVCASDRPLPPPRPPGWTELAPRLVTSYAPRASSGTALVDVVAAAASGTASGGDAIVDGGRVAAAVRARALLPRVGGAAGLLPLLAGLQGTVPPTSSSSVDRAAAALDVIAAAVGGKLDAAAWRTARGPSLAAHLLARARPPTARHNPHLTRDALRAATALAAATCGADKATGADTLRALVLAPRLWSAAPPDAATAAMAAAAHAAADGGPAVAAAACPEAYVDAARALSSDDDAQVLRRSALAAAAALLPLAAARGDRGGDAGAAALAALAADAPCDGAAADAADALAAALGAAAASGDARTLGAVFRAGGARLALPLLDRADPAARGAGVALLAALTDGVGARPATWAAARAAIARRGAPTPVVAALLPNGDVGRAGAAAALRTLVAVAPALASDERDAALAAAAASVAADPAAASALAAGPEWLDALPALVAAGSDAALALMAAAAAAAGGDGAARAVAATADAGGRGPAVAVLTRVAATLADANASTSPYSPSRDDWTLVAAPAAARAAAAATLATVERVTARALAPVGGAAARWPTAAAALAAGGDIPGDAWPLLGVGGAPPDDGGERALMVAGWRVAAGLVGRPRMGDGGGVGDDGEPTTVDDGSGDVALRLARRWLTASSGDDDDDTNPTTTSVLSLLPTVMATAPPGAASLTLLALARARCDAGVRAALSGLGVPPPPPGPAGAWAAAAAHADATAAAEAARGELLYLDAAGAAGGAAAAALRAECGARAAADAEAATKAALTAADAAAALVTADANRRAVAEAEAADSDADAARRWESAWRVATGDTGAWRGAAPTPTAPPRYKLSQAEDAHRRRLILKQDHGPPLVVAGPRGGAGGATAAAAADGEPRRSTDEERAAGAAAALAGVAVRAPGEEEEEEEEEEKGDTDAAAPPSPAVDSTPSPAAPPPAPSIDASPTPPPQPTTLASPRTTPTAPPPPPPDAALVAPCCLVRPLSVRAGTLVVASGELRFTGDGGDGDADTTPPPPPLRKAWSLTTITEIHVIRRGASRKAVALSFSDRRRPSALFGFGDATAATAAATALAAVCPRSARFLDKRAASAAAARATAAWSRRELSTFDYLMRLNTLAGRTFSDLSLYPVFPWILADYHSATLNLDDPAVYRDLAKPVGALTPARAADFASRYASLAADGDPAMPPFHYGSHYSSAGAVVSVLLFFGREERDGGKESVVCLSLPTHPLFPSHRPTTSSASPPSPPPTSTCMAAASTCPTACLRRWRARGGGC